MPGVCGCLDSTCVSTFFDMFRLTSQGSQFDFFSLVANVKYAGLIKHEVLFLVDITVIISLVFDEGLNIFLFPTQI